MHAHGFLALEKVVVAAADSLLHANPSQILLSSSQGSREGVERLHLLSCLSDSETLFFWSCSKRVDAAGQ